MRRAGKKRPPKIRPTKVRRDSLQIIDVVADGAIAIPGFAFGRLLPLFIVDTAERPDVSELIRIHKHVETGDVRAEWAYMTDEKAVALILNFDRPIDTRLTLYLPVQKYGGMIDQILSVKALLLQSGALGDRLSTTMNEHRIVVQVGTRRFEDDWDEIFLSVTAAHFREKGRGRRESRELASEAIRRIRALQAFTMPNSSDSPAKNSIIKQEP